MRKQRRQFEPEEALCLLQFPVLFVFQCGSRCSANWLGESVSGDHQVFCARLHPPGNGSFLRSAGAGREGVSLRTCVMLPFWEHLNTLAAKAVCDRTEVEASVMTALVFIGQATFAVMRSLQLVMLISALEVMLIGEFETIGKRSKVSRRAARLAAATKSEVGSLTANEAERLYRLRSECVHAGSMSIEESDVELAFHFVSVTIRAFLSRPPFCDKVALGDILGLLDPPAEFAYQI